MKRGFFMGQQDIKHTQSKCFECGRQQTCRCERADQPLRLAPANSSSRSMAIWHFSIASSRALEPLTTSMGSSRPNSASRASTRDRSTFRLTRSWRASSSRTSTATSGEPGVRTSSAPQSRSRGCGTISIDTGWVVGASMRGIFPNELVTSKANAGFDQRSPIDPR